MPQDRPRSVLYRSFLTCDDPRGVVECSRIRKSKMVDDKLIKQTPRESMNVSSLKKEGEEEKVLNASSCSNQLMEVSRGAQKLTRVIESWSKRSGLDGRSKDVAKDLLKGALDLQESLEMLEKLQKASGFKPKQKSGKGVVERTKSERIMGDEKYKVAGEFHKPRHSIDGASWDCYDELREVIRESFGRNNLLGAKEKASFVSRELDFFSPSTSSSQSSFENRCFDSSTQSSSVFQSHEFSSFGNSLPKAKNLRPKAPNLIAKLMGLEEIPLEHLEKDRLSKNPRRPPIVVDNMDLKQRTLEDIINESKRGIHQPVISDLESEVAQYCSPIVIMRPQYAPNNIKRGEKSEVTKSTSERGAKTSRNESGIKAMGKQSSNKTNNPAKARQEKKEVIEKRVDKIQKIAPKMRKEETKNVKFREAAKPRELEKMTSSVKLRKQDSLPNISQKQVTHQKSATSNKKCIKKTDKLVENLGGDKARVDLKPKKETDKTENKDELSEKLHLEEVYDVSQTLIIDDDHIKAESLSCVSTEPTIQTESKECDQYCITPKSNPEANTTKNLLLTSKSFLTHAEELFDTYAWQPVEFKPDTSHNETPETKLLLDIASELLENKKSQISPSVHIELDKLADEICDGIETLTSYKDLTPMLSADTLYGLVERDLFCQVAVSGAWDSGWRKGFSWDEVEHVVAEMEKLILEDAIAEFAWQ